MSHQPTEIQHQTEEFVPRPNHNEGLDKFDSSRPDRFNRDRVTSLVFVVGLLAILTKLLGYW